MMQSMKATGIEWDNGNWPKCGKHGVSRDEIEQLFFKSDLKIAFDEKHSTPAEERLIAVGQVHQRNLLVVFAYRNNKIRPINARYMHEKEVKSYEKSS